MSKKTDEYAAALDKLERMRASGEVSQGRYDVMRANLLAESSKPRKTAVGVGLAIVALVVVFVFGSRLLAVLGVGI